MLRNRALLFALFIGLMGLLPHVLFSLNTGGLHYVTGAWDEDSYSKYLLTYNDVVHRLLSNSVMRFMHALLGLDLAIITMDAVMPAIAAFITVHLAHALGFTARYQWILASFLMLFAMELMTFSHPYFWPDPVTRLSPFASFTYPPAIRMFVPNVFQNFFGIYKAPEPQFCLIFQLGALFAMLRYAQTGARRYLWWLLPVAMALPFIYITTGITLLLLVAGYGLIGLLLRRRAQYLWWVAAAALLAGYVAWAHLAFRTDGPALDFVFHSRLPVIGASMIYGLFGFWLIWRQWRFNPPEPVLLAWVALAVPMVALNQQIITGIMVQSRSWEYYSNYPFVALGLLILWPQISAFIPRRIKGWSRYLCLLLVALFIYAQFMTYKAYQKGDMVALGYADGIKAAGDFKGPVLLDNPDHDSQVWLRVGNPDLTIIAGYQALIANPIARLDDPDYEATYDALKDQAFTLFDRKGTSAHELQQLVTDGIGTGGWYVRYFFAMLDCWYPLSDFRVRNPDPMLARVPDIVSDYQEFLNDPARRNQFGEMLYLTETPISESRKDVPWTTQKVAMIVEGRWRPETIYVYRQVPK